MHRHRAPAPPWILAAFLANALFVPAASAREDMSGTWKEDYNEVVFSVDQWGEECGEAPRSTGRAHRGLTFTVEDRGVDLMFKSSAQNFTTSGCQSDNPAIKPKERTLKDNLFLIDCATPETDQSYESGLYSFRVQSAKEIEYRETTRFSRNVAGGLCVYTRRVRRMYLREGGTQAATEKPDAGAPAQPEEPVVGTKVQATPEDPCKSPGPPFRMTVTPDQASLAPGEKACPKFQFKDQQTCPTQGKPSLVAPPAGVELTADGCLLVTEKAQAGSHPLQLESGHASAAFELVVVRCLASSRVTAPPEPTRENLDEPVPVLDAGPMEAPDATAAQAGEADAGPLTDKAAPQEPEPQKPAITEGEAAEGAAGWVLPAGIAVGILVFAGLVVFLLLGRRRAQRALPVARMTEAPTKPEPLRPQPVGEAEKKPTVFCTSCGRAIPAQAKFCPFDRTPVHHPGSPTLPSSPVCPTCHRLLPVGAKFCPFDRTKLG